MTIGRYSNGMDSKDALAAGHLTEAIALQVAVVRSRPADPVARLFLFELFTLAGQLKRARHHLRKIVSADPAWPRTRQNFWRILKAEHGRSRRGRNPSLPKKPPHARYRRRALQALSQGETGLAGIWIDRADAAAPDLVGHVDGREFEGLRDTDDRYASVVEVFVRDSYLWLPFDAIRRITLAPAVGVLDTAFRPARLKLADGAEFNAVLPLLYPRSFTADEEYALGRETDWPETPGGLVLGIGAKVWIVGEEEVVLGDCRQFDILAR